MFGGRPGHSIVAIDYGAIEVRVAAAVTGDPVMRDILNDPDSDPHTSFASRIYGVPYDEVTGDQRAMAKAMNFTLLFGGGEGTLFRYARNSGSSLSEAEMRTVVDTYFETFKGVLATRQRAESLAHSRRAVVVRLPSGLKRVLAGSNLTSTRLLNTTVQGTAAAGLKWALVEIDKAGLLPYLCAVIHDEIVLEVPNPLVDEIRQAAEQAMITGMARVLPGIRIVVESTVGTHWEK